MHFPFGIAVLLGALLAGCSKQVNWTEEVTMNDGTKQVVTRSVKLERFHGPLSESMNFVPANYSVSAFNKQSGDFVVWRGAFAIRPIALEFVGKDSYLILLPERTDTDLREYGCPRLPYIFLRYQRNYYGWMQIDPATAPEAIRQINLIDYDPYYIKDEDRIGMSKGLKMPLSSKPQTNFKQQPIPRHLEEWRYEYKNEYTSSWCVPGALFSAPLDLRNAAEKRWRKQNRHS
jgi:hypothetical protein